MVKALRTITELLWCSMQGSTVHMKKCNTKFLEGIMHHGETSVFAQLHTRTISAGSIVTVKQLDVICMTLHRYVHIYKDCAQPCWPPERTLTTSLNSAVLQLTPRIKKEKGLTHAVDSVIDEEAVFTPALETTRDVVTFLITSGGMVWICTLVNVCESFQYREAHLSAASSSSSVALCLVYIQEQNVYTVS